MKLKRIIICTILIVVVSITTIIALYGNNKYQTAQTVYQVYLDGQKIGAIESDQTLYNLIDKEQQEIKNEYNVDRVYPPNGLEVVKHLTYNGTITEAESVYSIIKDEKPFTIKGSTIIIRSLDEENKEIIQEIYVLNEEIFKSALTKVVTTFITAKQLDDYLNDTQSPIIDTGEIIEKMEFDEKFTIKDSYIDSNARIFTNEANLVQYLLFGDNSEEKLYTVKQGDTIASIAENNQLNVQELLIANPKLTSANNLLAIGEVLNITLIAPVLTLVYEMEVVRDDAVNFETITRYDPSKYSSYSFTEQEGEAGIRRNVVKIRVVNGEEQQGAQIVDYETLKETVNKIVVKGTRGGSGPINVTNSSWGWPTAQPYYISSEYAYRWGKHHDGLDITGTGYGSPIYAVQSGVVISSGQGSNIIGGSTAGIAVTIDHENGYYTLYAHLSQTYVTVGQRVSKGNEIGAMGNTGFVSPKPTAANPTAGTHVHFSVFNAYPYSNGTSNTINPRNLWR